MGNLEKAKKHNLVHEATSAARIEEFRRKMVQVEAELAAVKEEREKLLANKDRDEKD